jgi:hypothetical protein
MRGSPARSVVARLTGWTLPILVLVGCSTSTGRPDTARLRVTGEDGRLIELVTSTEFLLTDGTLTFIESDTSMVTSPYDETYRLGEPARFHVTGYNVEPDTSAFRVRVWIDDKEWFDDAKVLAEGETFEFTYTFTEPFFASVVR